MSSERSTKSIAGDALSSLGLGEEKKPVERQRGYGSGYGQGSFMRQSDEDWLRGGRSGGSYARAKAGEDDEDIPLFLRRGAEGSRSVSSSPASPRKHTSERTASYAPHSYIKSEEKFKVGDTMKLAEAALFSEEAAKFIANRVHEAMADALERYGLIWSGAASAALKAAVREQFENCTYKKPIDGGSQYVAVRVGKSEIDHG